ncbi:Eco57I restriction-modification methylase domain-containing protein [Candidatus Woesebacteria bacterium]|nr:Eco57I restriction-modification methylase domain-containing protein [Candidatus Woesebacteria bacterium]
MKNNLTYNTSPSEYAESLGSEFVSRKSKNDISSLGQFFTPKAIAEMVANDFEECSANAVRILDPGAGSGILSCALCEAIAGWDSKPKKIKLSAYEIDTELVSALNESLTYLKKWLIKHGISLEFVVHQKDFVLENAEVLNTSLQQSLLDSKNFEEFDLIVANPPYFKIAKSDPRAVAATPIIHGQPNIYALFMAIAAYLLKERGQLGFITPRSYASGLYFKKFRENFFEQIIPQSIHIFESRDKAFGKDGVLQENVILHARKDKSIDRDSFEVEVSSCDGLSDIANSKSILIPLEEIISLENGHVLHIPTKVEQREIVKIVKSWKYNLHSLGFEVSTGPIVAFRARELLDSEDLEDSNAPLLWLQNIKTMKVSWPVKSRKPQYVKTSQEAQRLLLPNNNYVLIRRFSAKEEKKRLVAAPFISEGGKSKFVGIENHINYIYRKNGSLSDTEALGLAAVLNSSLLDEYFRVFSGNTQVSATELRNIPLPDPDVIERIGKTIKNRTMDLVEIDQKVTNLIRDYA